MPTIIRRRVCSSAACTMSRAICHHAAVGQVNDLCPIRVFAEVPVERFEQGLGVGRLRFPALLNLYRRGTRNSRSYRGGRRRCRAQCGQQVSGGSASCSVFSGNVMPKARSTRNRSSMRTRPPTPRSRSNIASRPITAGARAAGCNSVTTARTISSRASTRDAVSEIHCGACSAAFMAQPAPRVSLH